MSIRTVHVFASGRVQGVFYRDTTQKNAQILGITGWVKNLDDGRVELKATGEKAVIEEFLTLCNAGSTLANVDSLEVIDIPVEAFTEFKIHF